MTHETMVVVSQIASLALFASLFAAVLVYVALPRNKSKFERAARLPLEGDETKLSREA